MQFAATHHRPLSAQVRLRADVRRTILTDEAVSFEFTLIGLEPRTVSAVALQELAPSGWVDHSTIWTPPQQPGGSGRVRLHAGSTAIRCRLSSFDNRAKPTFTTPLPVDTREAPRILILLSMGGAWTGAPPTPPGNPNATGSARGPRYKGRRSPLSTSGHLFGADQNPDDQSQRAV